MAVINIKYNGKIDEIAAIIRIKYFNVLIDILRMRRGEFLVISHPPSGRSLISKSDYC